MEIQDLDHLAKDPKSEVVKHHRAMYGCGILTKAEWFWALIRGVRDAGGLFAAWTGDPMMLAKSKLFVWKDNVEGKPAPNSLCKSCGQKLPKKRVINALLVHVLFQSCRNNLNMPSLPLGLESPREIRKEMDAERCLLNL